MIKLSDHIEQRLQQLGFQNDLSAWEIGDLTEWIFQRVRLPDGTLINPETEEQLQSHDLYAAIGKHAGKSPHAVRDYHYTSSRIPRELRNDYHMLGRHHWKALIPHARSEHELKEWAEKILEWADDYGGAIISVAALRLKLASKDNGGEKRWARAYRLARLHCERILKQKDVPHIVTAAVEQFLKTPELT